MRDTAVLVPAAGRGERLGPGLPKALRLLRGEPLVVHAVRALSQAGSVAAVVVAAPAEQVDAVRSMLAGHHGTAALLVVPGGVDRCRSVAAALAAAPADLPVVLVHDAARCLVPAELVDRVAAAVRAGSPAVVPVLPVSDTVKRVDQDGTVLATLDRSDLRAVQTPQGFGREVLIAAHGAIARTMPDTDTDTDTDFNTEPDPGVGITDDAGLVERIGVPVRTVPGSAEAFKVTSPFDLALAENVLSRMGQREGPDGTR